MLHTSFLLMEGFIIKESVMPMPDICFRRGKALILQ